jgi:hypothetical protein
LKRRRRRQTGRWERSDTTVDEHGGWKSQKPHSDALESFAKSAVGGRVR